MPRSAFILVLALAALTAPTAQAQYDRLRTAAAKFAKNKGDKGGKCSVGAPVITDAGVVPDSPTTVDHPFSVTQARAFIDNQNKPPLLNHYTTTFDCVDSREPSDGTNKHLGTPGGDFSELSSAIITYCKLTDNKCSFELVQRIFQRFMSQVASPSRPFYLHQGESKLQKVFDDVLASGLVSERPPALPRVAPPEGPLRDVYLESLVVGVHQGCGHVRLTIDKPAEYGLEGELVEVPKHLLKAFYLYWWPTPLNSAERKKIEFPILQGNLEGDAIILVNAAAESGACSHRSPSITHAFWGGQAFVYNAAAADDFRKVKLVEFFKGVAKAEGTTLPDGFYTSLSALQGQQLDSTLKYLDVAKDCPILVATYA